MVLVSRKPGIVTIDEMIDRDYELSILVNSYTGRKIVSKIQIALKYQQAVKAWGKLHGLECYIPDGINITTVFEILYQSRNPDSGRELLELREDPRCEWWRKSNHERLPTKEAIIRFCPFTRYYNLTSSNQAEAIKNDHITIEMLLYCYLQRYLANDSVNLFLDSIRCRNRLGEKSLFFSSRERDGIAISAFPLDEGHPRLGALSYQIV